MVLFFTAMSALACGIGKGRASWGPFACAVSRYGWLSVPICLWIYLAASRFSRPPLTKIVHSAMVLGMVFLAQDNFKDGRQLAFDMRMQKDAGNFMMTPLEPKQDAS